MVVDFIFWFVNFVDRVLVGRVWSILESGSLSSKVDFLVIGEGYMSDELLKFHDDVVCFVGVLFSEKPFVSRRFDFNVWGLDFLSL